MDTKSNITAQNESQSKIMGVFTRNSIERITKGSKLPAATVIDYLKRAEGIIDRLKCSDDTKSFLKSGYGLFGSLLDNRTHYNKWIATEFYPKDLDGVNLEDPSTYPVDYGSADEIIEQYELELSDLLNDLWDMLRNNEDGFYNDDIQEYMDIFEAYIDSNSDIYYERINDSIRQERDKIEEELERQGLEGRY